MERTHGQSKGAKTGASILPGGRLEITPELVMKIADQVYAALLRDLVIERERSRRITEVRIRGTGRIS